MRLERLKIGRRENGDFWDWEWDFDLILRSENRSEMGLKSLKTKSLFGQGVSTTQFSVSITHNSKMVGPIAKSLFGQTITLFS